MAIATHRYRLVEALKDPLQFVYDNRVPLQIIAAMLCFCGLYYGAWTIHRTYAMKRPWYKAYKFSVDAHKATNRICSAFAVMHLEQSRYAMRMPGDTPEAARLRDACLDIAEKETTALSVLLDASIADGDATKDDAGNDGRTPQSIAPDAYRLAYAYVRRATGAIARVRDAPRTPAGGTAASADDLFEIIGEEARLLETISGELGTSIEKSELTNRTGHRLYHNIPIEF